MGAEGRKPVRFVWMSTGWPYGLQVTWEWGGHLSEWTSYCGTILAFNQIIILPSTCLSALDVDTISADNGHNIQLDFLHLYSVRSSDRLYATVLCVSNLFPCCSSFQFAHISIPGRWFTMERVLNGCLVTASQHQIEIINLHQIISAPSALQAWAACWMSSYASRFHRHKL